MPAENIQSILDAKDTYMAILELSKLLNTKLDAEAISICIQLCEAGVNPDALSACIHELRREMKSVHEMEESNKDDVANKNN